MKGNFDLSIKTAKEDYNYVSPQESGSLPKGIFLKGEKYLLMPLNHAAICDSKYCQTQGITYNKENPPPNKYTTSPIYSNWGKHELCVVCAKLENLVHFTPNEDEKKRMLLLINKQYMNDDSELDEGDDEGDEGDDEGDEVDEIDEEVDEEDDLIKQLNNILI